MGRTRLRVAALISTFVLAWAMPWPVAAEELGTERIFGFDLDAVAKATCRFTSFRTQYGEEAADAKFEEWLASQGQSRDTYTSAYNAYWERFRADKTGKLEARFHTLIAEYTRRFEYGDIPDRSQEVRGGLSLDRYAEVAVALTRPPGVDLPSTLKKYGLSAAQWQQANEAWGQAMKEDSTFALAQQYGQLYQKHAGPGFAQEREAQLAGNLAGRFDQKTEPSPPPAQPTTAERRAALKSSSRTERWEAARPLAHQCSLLPLLGKKAAADPRAPDCKPEVLRQELLPVMADIIDHHQDTELNRVTGLLGYIEDFGWQKDLDLTLRRTLNRWRAHLETLEAAFAPIQHKALPERIPLRTKIDEHQASIRELERQLAEWSKTKR